MAQWPALALMPAMSRRVIPAAAEADQAAFGKVTEHPGSGFAGGADQGGDLLVGHRDHSSAGAETVPVLPSGEHGERSGDARGTL
jgi:hypothetical protein